MNVVIIGARKDGHAKVVLEMLWQCTEYNVIGFLDDDKSKTGDQILGVPVLGPVALISGLRNTHSVTGFFIALGNNKLRREIGETLIAQGFTTFNLVHPTVHKDKHIEIGTGNLISPNSVILTGARIRNFVNIHVGVSIDHDNLLEDGVNLAPGTHLAGRVHIMQDSFLGTGTICIPDIVVGQGCIIGAGSVIIRNLPNFIKAVGNPAKIIEQLA